MATRMQTYIGRLTMLGNSKRGFKNDADRIYSVIEIGDHTLINVGCDNLLDNYLHRALDHNGDVELEIKKSFSPAQWVLFILIFTGLCPVLWYSTGWYLLFGPLTFIAFLTLLVSIHAMLFKKKEFMYYCVKAVTIDGKRYTD